MTDPTENLVLELLRSIRADISSIKDDVREVKGRVTDLEVGQATILKHVAHLAGANAEQHSRNDRILERIERLEKRLELA
jgi:hypothetical protein